MTNEDQVADLKRQLETERATRVWHANNSVETSRWAGAVRQDADKVLERAERNRKISLGRLRRAQNAEEELAHMRHQRDEALERAGAAEAELRACKRECQQLHEALFRAANERETHAATWRLKAEEWEAKYKEAIESEGSKWQFAVDTWRTRYEEAIRRFMRLEAKEAE